MTSRTVGLVREGMIRLREPKAGENNLKRNFLSKMTVRRREGKQREGETKGRGLSDDCWTRSDIGSAQPLSRNL